VKDIFHEVYEPRDSYLFLTRFDGCPSGRAGCFPPGNWDAGHVGGYILKPATTTGLPRVLRIEPPQVEERASWERGKATFTQY